MDTALQRQKAVYLLTCKVSRYCLLPLHGKMALYIRNTIACRELRPNMQLTIHGPSLWGGGPRVVVSTAAFHARVRDSVPGLGGLKETKMFLPIHV